MYQDLMRKQWAYFQSDIWEKSTKNRGHNWRDLLICLQDHPESTMRYNILYDHSYLIQ